jgi:hypothetical protein
MLRSFFGSSLGTTVWTLWFAATVFVFPIPGTIALRNLLLLGGLAVLALGHFKRRPQPVTTLRPAAWSLLALTGWIVVQAATLSPSPDLAFSSMRGDWLVPLLIGYTGAWAATRIPANRSLQAVVIALAAHMLWLLAWQFNLWLVSATWPFKATPFAAYDYQGTLNSFFLALLAADRLAWTLTKSSPLGISPRIAWILVIVSLAADLALGSRNSTVITVVLLLAAILALLSSQARHWRKTILAIGMIMVVGASSLINDSRWRGGIESAALGWNSPGLFFKSAHDFGSLTLPSGKPVEHSAFVRAALASLAIDGMKQNPMGVGIGNDAFGRLVPPQYGFPTMGGSSHNGWLDFALGTGLPGLGMLLLTAGFAIRNAWRQFKETSDGAALLLSFFVGGYLLRCLLDGHLSGWRLGLFAFVVGILIAGMREQPENP